MTQPSPLPLLERSATAIITLDEMLRRASHQHLLKIPSLASNPQNKWETNQQTCFSSSGMCTPSALQSLAVPPLGRRGTIHKQSDRRKNGGPVTPVPPSFMWTSIARSASAFGVSPFGADTSRQPRASLLCKKKQPTLSTDA